MERYDITKTFDANRTEGPYGYEQIEDKNTKIEHIAGPYGVEKDLFGFKTRFPIGVAAGSLFNERYMKAAAKDGFSVLTWKTFRTRHWEAHTNDGSYLGHNIVSVPLSHQLSREHTTTRLQGRCCLPNDRTKLTITNSFGMPSTAPEQWKPEVREIEGWMKRHNKLTITSVVGTPQPGWNIEDLAEDYASCALLAEDAGASIVEMNFSCPNVQGEEGTLYKHPETARLICQSVRKRLTTAKLLIKVGWAEKAEYRALLSAVHPYIDGVTAINTIPMGVVDNTGKQALPGGLITGVCGWGILSLAVDAVQSINELRRKEDWDIALISCGGVTTPEHIMRHIDAGSDMVTVATAALFCPELPERFAEYLRDNEIKR